MTLPRVLLIAFHFPPLQASSGLQRPLSMVRYLPARGWQPVVLTATTRAYGRIAAHGSTALPAGAIVARAPALDAARHLAVRGRYPGFLARPDRWSSWLAGAIPLGLQVIRRHRPEVLWSTYPLATAHLIGFWLHRFTGLPWVADFRDPMVEQIDGAWYPEEPHLRGSRLATERRVAAAASAATFCTDTARAIFLDRYPAWQGREAAHVIANGFDPEAFALAETLPAAPADGAITLVHSGTLYPGPDRDPSAFFAALDLLRARGALPPALRVVLRATGFDEFYQPMIDRLQLGDVVSLAPAVPYPQALREMLDAAGLLLFQGRTSNPAIPAKLYEYLRARRPILALADHQGETAALLRRVGVGALAPVDDAEGIARAIEGFLTRRDGAAVLDVAAAEGHSRVRRVDEFATLFTRLAGGQVT